VRTAAKLTVLGLMVLGIASTQVDLGSTDVWRTVEEPFGVTYPVLVLTRVVDGDTFEAWVHIAPRLAYFADIRLDRVYRPQKDRHGQRGEGRSTMDTPPT